MGAHKEVGQKTQLQPWLSESLNYRETLLRRTLLHLLIENYSKPVKELIVLLVLLKGLPKHFPKVQAIPDIIREALPPTR